MKSFDCGGLAEKYQSVLAKIRSAEATRSVSQKVTLIAVSKTQPAEAIEALYQLGHRDFGENYVQELVEKATLLKEWGLNDIRWHFIGHLQSNKAKIVLPFLSSIHTVDSERLAVKLEGLVEEKGRTIPVFVQVNIDQEPTKSGLSPSEVLPFLKRVTALKGIDIQGLMCIPSPSSDLKSSFERLSQLNEEGRIFSKGMLSMGDVRRLSSCDPVWRNSCTNWFQPFWG